MEVKISGSFQVAKKRFCYEAVIYLCDGRFGGMSKDFKKAIYCMAMEAAVDDGGLVIVLLVKTDWEGRAFPIKIRQIKRAMGVAVVSGQAKYKSGTCIAVCN